jgi:hypothetical protein
VLMQYRRITYLGSLLVLLSLITAIGCDFGPKTIEVNGTVTLDGSPLGGVQVEYIPDDTTLTSGVGRADPTTGEYKIIYPGEGIVGVPEGTYTVSITPDEDEDAEPVQVPSKYQGGNSELKMTVPSADGTYDLTLTSN